MSTKTKKPSTKTKKTSGTSTANQQRILVNYGPNTLAAKQALSKKLWKQQLGLARQSGYTIESYFDKNTPNPLKERTQAGIKQQAMDTVNAAYAPSEVELSRSDAKIKAVADKRSVDNQYYLDWLDNKSKEAQGQAAAQAAALQEHQATIQAETAQNYHDLRNQLVEQANARPGNVSNNAQATALDVSPEAKRTADTIAAQRTSTDNTIATAASSAAATRANNVAVIAAAQSKNISNMYDQLAQVGSDKIKLQLDKASTATKEIGRLLDQEIDKVRNNRDFSALLQKLDLQGQTVAAGVQKTKTQAASANADRKTRAAIAKGQQNTTLTAAQIRAQQSDRNSQRTADSAAKDRQTRRDIAAQKKAAGSKGLTAGQQNKNQQQANSTISAIHTAQRIIKSHPPPKGPNTPLDAKTRKRLHEAGIDSEDIIKIGYDLAVFGKLRGATQSIADRIFGPLTADGKAPRL